MLIIFPLYEAIRSGGDWRQLGGHSRHQMTIRCPDGVVTISLTAVRLTQAPDS